MTDGRSAHLGHGEMTLASCVSSGFPGSALLGVGGTSPMQQPLWWASAPLRSAQPRLSGSPSVDPHLLVSQGGCRGLNQVPISSVFASCVSLACGPTSQGLSLLICNLGEYRHPRGCCERDKHSIGLSTQASHFCSMDGWPVGWMAGPPPPLFSDSDKDFPPNSFFLGELRSLVWVPASLCIPRLTPVCPQQLVS